MSRETTGRANGLGSGACPYLQTFVVNTLGPVHT